MKKWIVRILVAVLALGAFAAVGFVGYRMGFSRGAQASGNIERSPRGTEPFHRDGMPEFEFSFQNREFNHGFQMRQRGGFGFSPFISLARVALLGLVIWLAYMIFKGNGWTVSLTRVQPAESLKAETESSRKKTAKKDS